MYGAEGARSGRYLTVKKPLSMYGAGRGKTTLVGVGLFIQGNKTNGIVKIEDLTIKGGEGHGLCARGGMNVIMREISIVVCQREGVLAQGVNVTCNNLQVIGCGGSGVFASTNATIILSGESTSIQGNGTREDSSSYGLNAYDFCFTKKKNRSLFSSNIHLVHPLTKEEISTNNGGGRNWGGYSSMIEQVTK